jgi:hypothetical protein
MTLDSYRRDVQRHQAEIARLQREKSQEAAKAADETRRSNGAADAARKTSSESMARSKLRDSQAHAERSATCQRKVADLEGKIAREQARLNDAQKRLTNAESIEHRRALRDQERAAKEHERRISAITGTLKQHDQLHRLAMSALEKLQHVPDTITVLFVAANPLNLEILRLDEEARSIREMIRQSKYRDAVRFESRWAARPLDLLQAINECRPTVVHFSGHGSDRDEIVFQDSAGNAKVVSKEAIVETMAAASDEIQLVFFNACYSHGQAEAVVQYVPSAIGMNTAISDDAARTFAAQFYSAIGFGFSISRAFAQARAAVMLEGLPEHATPELFVADGLSAEDFVLVAPSARGDESSGEGSEH